MKKNLCIRLIATIVLLPGFISWADEGDYDESPLHEEMEIMNDAFKPLVRAMRNPDPANQEQYLEWIQAMQVSAVNSKVYVPRYFAELSEEEAGKMLVEYRVDMTKFIATLLELEAAVLLENWEEASEIAGGLRDHRKHGHSTYDPE